MTGIFNIINQFGNFVTFIVYVMSSIINNIGIYVGYVFTVTQAMPLQIYTVIASFLVLDFLFMVFFHK